MMGSFNGRPSRVLIVDDDPELRHMLAVLFESEDYQVVGEAGDGLDAVTMARRTQPDFIVLDYMMPNMDGQTASPMLRAVAPETRIVAFSAVLERKPDWADAFLTKNHIVQLAPLLESLVSEKPRTPA